MQTYNRIGLRESLEQLETAKLDELLQAELEKVPPDPDSVRLIMSILEERDAAAPTPVTDEEQAAWQLYQNRMAGLQKKPAPIRRWLTVAASVILVVGLMFAVVPQQAEAETFWEMLQRWSDSIFEVLNPREHISSLDYHFETNNPGLQQVYDAVVELGVTDPVVPMWIPDEFVMMELNSKDTPMSKNIWAWFSSNNSEMMFKVDVYEGEPAHQFYKDGSHYEEYEKNGMNYYITQNNGSWVAVWTKDNIECFLTLDCQEDTLRRILGSIYVMEES